ERPQGQGPECPAPPAGEAGELARALDEEIDRLPEKYRAPLILCCLQDLSYERAAQSLRVTEPTLRGRLHRARGMLRERLRRRGLGPATVLGERAWTGIIPPSPSPALVDSTVRHAISWPAIAGPGAGPVSMSVVTLAQGAIHTMLVGSIKSVAIP